MSFTTLLHSLTIILLYFIRTKNALFDFQPLTLRYMLFLSYGVVLGLWSTIATRKCGICLRFIDQICLSRFYLHVNQIIVLINLCSIISSSLSRSSYCVYIHSLSLSSLSLLYQFNMSIHFIFLQFHLLLLLLSLINISSTDYFVYIYVYFKEYRETIFKV